MKRVADDQLPSSTKRSKEFTFLEPNTWHIVENDALMVKLASTSSDKSTVTLGKKKIFAFDLDGCIIETKSGNLFAKDKNDWRFLHGLTIFSHAHLSIHECAHVYIFAVLLVELMSML